MDIKKLNKQSELQLKIADLERMQNYHTVHVRNDEPYFEEVKELIKTKRQEYIDQLKKELEAA